MDMNIMRMKGRTKMMRTIKVTGKGKIAVKPDIIRLHVNKEELCKKYEDTLHIDRAWQQQVAFQNMNLSI